MTENSWLRSWGRGWIVWRPPPALRTEYLIAWAVALVALVLVAPLVAGLPLWGRAACAAGAILAATTVNAVFQRLGS